MRGFKHGLTQLLGVQLGVGSVQSGVWLPHTQVNDHVRVGVVNNGDWSSWLHRI